MCQNVTESMPSKCWARMTSIRTVYHPFWKTLCATFMQKKTSKATKVSELRWELFMAKKSSGRTAPAYPWSLDTTHPESNLRSPSQHRVESSTMNPKCLHYRGMDGRYMYCLCNEGCVYHHTSGIELRFPNDISG